MFHFIALPTLQVGIIVFVLYFKVNDKPNKYILLRFQDQNPNNKTARTLMKQLLYLDIHQCSLRREMTIFTKSFTNNKKQHASLKLLLKVSNKVSEEIQATTALVFNICLIQRLCIRHFLHHQLLFKTVTNLIYEQHVLIWYRITLKPLIDIKIGISFC